MKSLTHFVSNGRNWINLVPRRFHRLLTICAGKALFTVILLDAFLGTSNAEPPSGYTLAWSDEFNNPVVETNEWKFRVGPSSHSYQQAENVSIEKDGLHIAEKAEAHGNFQYTGGGVITQRAWKYGYFETRVKAGDSGWHEAFWTTVVRGFDDKANGLTPNSIEIDALEHDIGGWPSVSHDGISFGLINWTSSRPL